MRLRIHEVQQALEALGVWRAIKNAQGGAGAIATSVGAVIASFLDLTDTPETYKDQAGKTLIVSGSEDGLEFTEFPSGVTEHSDLTGLDADDHTQYHTDDRADTWGDAKYLQINQDLSDVSNAGTARDNLKDIRNGAITRDVNGLLESVVITDGRTLTVARDVNDNIETIADNTHTWTFSRTDGRITHWTVT